MARSPALNSTCTSFSASAKVVGDTSGPTGGAVPKAGGAPGGRSAGFCAWLRKVAAAPRAPRELTARNCLRDLRMDGIVACVNMWRGRLARAKGVGLINGRRLENAVVTSLGLTIHRDVQTSLTNHALLASTWFYAVGGRGARATLERFVSKYHSLERPRYEYRRRLPHYQSAAAPLFVTFGTFGRWTLPEAARDLVLRHCLHDHGRRIQLSIAVVMPNHVHLLFWALRDGDGWSFRLVDIMHSLKSASAHSVNRLLRREGPVWDEESFDHVLRSDESWEEKREYIRQNPARAGLVRRPEDYRWLWTDAFG